MGTDRTLKELVAPKSDSLGRLDVSAALAYF